MRSPHATLIYFTGPLTAVFCAIAPLQADPPVAPVERATQTDEGADQPDAISHAPTCPTALILSRLSPKPGVTRYRIQHTGLDPTTGKPEVLRPDEYELISDGQRWRVLMPDGIAACDAPDAYLEEWFPSERQLSFHRPRSSPHAEAYSFLLTQALGLSNDAVATPHIERTCTCKASKPTPSTTDDGPPRDAFVEHIDALGWRHRMALTDGPERYVRVLETLIPKSRGAETDQLIRRVRFEVTAWDRDGLPQEVVRVVDDGSDANGFKEMGRSVLTVLERRELDPATFDASMKTPVLSNGWTVQDTQRRLSYVYGSRDFTVAGKKMRAESAIRKHPRDLTLDELLPPGAVTP
ncbi:MAG: hypothetical protein ACKO0W_02870 [Planctomycetota bacterium]